MSDSRSDTVAQHVNSYYAATTVGMRQFSRLMESVECDVCVIGGGFTGLSTAINLSERGYDVVVAEANRVGWGASGRNGGQVGTGLNQSQQEIEQSYGDAHANLLWDLCEEAKAEVRHRIAKHNIDCDYKSGVVGAAVNLRAASGYQQEVEHLTNRYGCNTVKYLDQQQVCEMFGERGYFGGKYDTDASHIHPLNYAIGLANASADNGTRIFEGCRVNSIKLSSDSIVAEISTGFTISAKFLVVACNAYLGSLVGELSRLILPIYSYILATEPLSESLATSINQDDVAVYDSRNDLDYYRLSADRRMLFGAGESYVRQLNEHEIEKLIRSRMLKLYPELKDARIDYRWGGRIALTVSRLPAVGRLNPKVYYAQGFSGHGVALTGLAGKVIAEAASGSEERFDAFAHLKHRQFPKLRWMNWWLYTLAMTYYRCRDYMNR